MERLEILLVLAVYGHLLATVVYGVWFFWRKKGFWIAGTSVLGLALALQLAFLIGMSVVGGRAPFKDTFETMVVIAAGVPVFYFVSLFFYGTKPLAPLVALATLFVTLFAYLIMPEQVENLVPALRSRLWLRVHVGLCLVSYVAFLLAYMIALVYLVKEKRHSVGAAFAIALTVSGLVVGIVMLSIADAPWWQDWWQHRRGTVLGIAAGCMVLLAVGIWPLLGLLEKKLHVRERLPDATDLGKMLYKIVAFGFPFLTLGIITGSYWASRAWGRYWGWDDKEVASLVTWLIFAVYLHVRFVPKWRGPWMAWIAVVGFWCVLFTYFGVNYLLTGLHSYG